MKNTFFKTYCVLFLFLAVFSCQDDDNASLAQTNQSGPKITIYEGKEANARKGALLAKLSKSGKLSGSKLHIVTASNQMRAVEQEVEINYDRVMETLDSFGNKHLTFEATSDIAPETIFFNLVVTEKEGKTKTVLVTFEMEASFAAEYVVNQRMEDFKGKITFTEITSDFGFPCDETPKDPINVSPGGGGGGGGNENPGGIPGSGSNPNPGGGYNQSIIDAQYLALQIMASMTDQWTDVHANPRYHRIAPVVTNPNPCGGGSEIGILEPDRNHVKNCQKLKKLFDNNPQQPGAQPNVRPKLHDLKNNINSQGETGFSMKNAASGYSNPDLPASGDRHLTIPTGTDIYGAGHSHRPGREDPMFSWGDVYGLYKIYLATAPANRPLATILLACKDHQGLTHVYALKIDNFDVLEQRLLQDLAEADGSTFNEKKRDIHKNRYEPVFENSLGNHERAFLNFFRDVGISLYEADDALNNWNKLSLNVSSPPFDCCENIIRTPCN